MENSGFRKNKKIRKRLGALEWLQPLQNDFQNIIMCKIMALFNGRNCCSLSTCRQATCSWIQFLFMRLLSLGKIFSHLQHSSSIRIHGHSLQPISFSWAAGALRSHPLTPFIPSTGPPSKLIAAPHCQTLSEAQARVCHPS